MDRSSNNGDKKFDTSFFVQKLYLRTKYMESNIEEDSKMNHYRIRNLPDPNSFREAASKLNVDNKYNDPSIIKNTSYVNFNDKNLQKVRFVKLNCLPAINQHLTPKQYLDNGIDEISFVIINQDKNLNYFSLRNKNS